MSGVTFHFFGSLEVTFLLKNLFRESSSIFREMYEPRAASHCELKKLARQIRHQPATALIQENLVLKMSLRNLNYCIGLEKLQVFFQKLDQPIHSKTEASKQRFQHHFQFDLSPVFPKKNYKINLKQNLCIMALDHRLCISVDMAIQVGGSGKGCPFENLSTFGVKC